jgi:hypothetical protein
MGHEKLRSKTNAQISAHIRSVSLATDLVVILDHARDRMLIRGVGINEVYEVLRRGSIVRPWKINTKYDTFECRMERYVGGRELAVGVTLDDADPAIIVVTVIVG